MSLVNPVHMDKKFALAVFVSGSGSNLQAIIDAIEENKTDTTKGLANASVALVISSRDGVYALERAKKHNINGMVIGKNETDMLLDALKSHNIDGIVLAGYLSILPSEIVDTYKNKIINIHPALLPMFGGKGFYGMRVHQAVIESGEKYSGASVHIVDGGIDTGAVLARYVVAVLPTDTPESLQKKIIEIEHDLLVTVVGAFTNGEIDELMKKPLLKTNEDNIEIVNSYILGLGERCSSKD
ncbi:MAG: phosphoribosylglycinamide formyltransferase [Oscillospiraceae bacterium]|nr:phosphoribosylglycinamide formyltransferase [Oscillospiraceae bacterium]